MLENELAKLGKDWLQRINELRALITGPLSKAERTCIRNKLNEGLQQRKARTICNWLAVGVVADQNYWIEQASAIGIFRASRYDYAPEIPQYVATSLLRHSPELHLTSASTSHLLSVIELLRIAAAVKLADSQLIKDLRKYRDGLLKGLVATLDATFMLRHEHGVLQMKGIIPEEFASGFSYLYHKLSTIYGLRSSDLGPIPDQLLGGDIYLDLLRRAVLVRKYMEWEIMVDDLGYYCTYDQSKRELSISAPDPVLAKSIALGYTQQLIQELAMFDRVSDLNIGSLQEMAKELGTKFKAAGLIQLEPKPVPRYVFKFPRNDALDALLQDNRLFLEEFATRAVSGKDLYLKIPELEALKISGTTVDTLLRMQRWFNIVRLAVSGFLVSRLPAEYKLVTQSLVPTFDRSKLLDFLSLTAEPSTAEELVDLLRWDSKTKSIFDVMYQPFVAGPNGTTLLPLNIVASTNLIRNTMQLKRVRVSMNSAGDTLGAQFADSLKSQGLIARGEVEYSFEGKAGEVDTVLLLGNKLFVWECKNSLHPASVFELRTSYDLILKATAQLDQFLDCWASSDFRTYLSRKLSWNLDCVSEVVTGIVTGNRMFLGYRSGRHAVRSYFELVSFILDGKIMFGSQSVELRPPGPIQSDDLDRYFTKDSVHAHTFAAMRRKDAVAEFATIKVNCEGYQLDMSRLAQEYGVNLDSLDEGRNLMVGPPR